MKTLRKAIRAYFRTLSVVAPSVAANHAFKLFQRTKKSRVRDWEQNFYEKASHGWVGEILYYKMGNPQHPLVFLIHGWNGHAGNFAAIADALVEQNYQIVAIDLPAHGRSLLTNTNLFKIADVLSSAFQRIADGRKFSIVAHSFGSAASVFTLAQKEIKVDKLILLSSPDRLQDIFRNFMKVIALKKSVFKYIQSIFWREFDMGIEDINVSSMIPRVDADDVVVIHDLYDRAIPFNYGLAVSSARADASMIMLDKIGHYKMLWNEEVITLLKQIFGDDKMVKKNLPQLEVALLANTGSKG